MPYKDPEIGKIRKREYHQKNKVKILEYQCNYRIINAEMLSEKTKTWQRENPEKYKAKNKLWNSKNKEKKKSIVLKNEYGITLGDYNDMFKLQNGCCAICGTHQTKLKRTLHVDHCHNTKKVRGLLCQHCNTFLGFAKDDINLFVTAIRYLNP